LYAVLGVPRTAAPDEIKKAYREAAFKYHPDRNPGDTAAEEKFKAVNAAYAVLGDESKRKEYDRYGSADDFARAPSSYGGSGGTTWNTGAEHTGDPFWDWFNDMQRRAERGAWYDPFEEANRQRRSYQRNPYGSRSAAFGALIRSAMILLVGMYFFRFSWYILPIGPFIVLLAIVNGVSGILKSLKWLFSSSNT
jgi:molecular chaperone DnaJ